MILIRDVLTKPPSSPMSVRCLTMKLKDRFDRPSILIEFPDEYDYYSRLKKYLQSNGVFDFVDDLIPFGDEDGGIRLDVEERRPHTIVVPEIVDENIMDLIDRIADLNRVIQSGMS